MGSLNWDIPGRTDVTSVGLVLRQDLSDGSRGPAGQLAAPTQRGKPSHGGPSLDNVGHVSIPKPTMWLGDRSEPHYLH